MHGLPHYQHHSPVCTFITKDEVTRTTHHQSPQFTLGLSLGVVQPMGLEKGIVTCIHYYSAIQDISLP